jgi:hypothetical protein
MHPIVRHYPERYRMYVPAGEERQLMLEECPTLDAMFERLATYPPAVRDFFPDVVHEHPYRILWHYRIKVVRTISLKEMGLR